MGNFKDIYFTKEYGLSTELIERGEYIQYVFENKNGKIIHNFIKREIPIKIDKEIYYDIITPYGYGGPLIMHSVEGKLEDLKREFNLNFASYCNDNRIISEFIRFHPILNNVDDFKYMYETSFSRNTLGTNLALDDPYMEEFDKGCRYTIRKILQANIKIEILENIDNLNDFISIYYKTMDRTGATEFYFFSNDYFDFLLKNLKENIIVVNAIYNETLISSELYFVYNDYIHYHLAGTLYDYLYLSPSYLMKYEIIKWGKERNYKIVHYGGGKTNSKQDSLYLYKKKFSKKTEFNFYVGKKKWNEIIYRKLCIENKSDIDSTFFPAYRT